MKIVINKCYGGFSISEAASRELGIKKDAYGFYSLNNTAFGIESDDEMAWRADSKLIDVVERLGKYASGECSELVVVDVPAPSIESMIIENDGMERVRY